ncbi:hypothetical protein Tco_1304762 [Tanacetum coccineum]
MESMSWYTMREPNHMIPNDGGGTNYGGLLEDEEYDIYDSYDLDSLSNKQWAVFEAYDINLQRKPRR